MDREVVVYTDNEILLSHKKNTFESVLMCGSAGKESTCNAGDLGLIPGLGRSPGEGNGYPLQYSDLENSTDTTAHGVAKSRTQLSDFHFTSLHMNHWLSTPVFVPLVICVY